MTLYVTERHLPGSTPVQLQALQTAALTSSHQFTAAGKPVQYLQSIWLPSDEQMLCLFQATDPTHVRDVNEAAGLPFTRIVEALALMPETSA